MVTASHNPAQYNGIKMARHDGLPISGFEIYEALPKTVPVVTEVHREDRQVVENYARHFMSVAGLKEGDCAGMKVAVDFGNGMGSVTIKRVLELLGADAVYLYEEPDARFPNHEANPAKWETLKDLQALIASSGAVLGVALDGDADRIGFLDGEGHILRGDQTLAIFTNLLMSQGKASRVVVAPNFGWGALDSIAASGAELVWERIGRGFVVKKMRELNIPLGGELSSHFFFTDTHELESVDYALMLILKGMKESGQTFAQMTESVRRFVNSAEINLHVEDKAGAIAHVKEVLAGEATSISELDGVRCEFNKDWWFIVRPSNTEPLLRLTVEAKDQAMLDEKVAMMRALIGGTQEH
jgi:phosphomannomutase